MNSVDSTQSLVSSNPNNSLSVAKLNNHDLESELKKLVFQERKLLHLILLHIKEVDNRKLYLKKAYPSLFEYLVKELGYSPASAMRRIDAARLLRDVPQMAEKIKSGQINLSQITEISRAIKEKQKERQSSTFISKQEKENLVLKVAGLSLAETQKALSIELDIKPIKLKKKRMQKDKSVRLELTLTKEQMSKLNQCKDLAAHILEQRRMDTSLASIIEVLMDQFLAKRGLAKVENKSGGKSENGSENRSENRSESKPAKKSESKSENECNGGFIDKQKSVTSDLAVNVKVKAKTEPIEPITPEESVTATPKNLTYKNKISIHQIPNTGWG